ncbi:hypothetical protein BBH51_07590 [Aggregatibacter actinomycetemcomitans]|uniref:TIGR03750 family conjugal transfer protein n=1 Tax=Aggregatibacter actinomycetemcomitans TaxID=714 RepID=A0A142G2Q9_AGGAC|nr:TIGR03750 family conjugal transfer protein [Aggregatibacter actinomycetemcomitans]AFI88005.1 membrane protein [Aggregatibacter actinomycetemcomitans D7S-1]KYK95210.1 membrane protein [Aggregatibacter actinomycetemcomitans serotype d str. SA3733]AMQ94939.1 hypothetical protein ACT75_10625 [Aggregatibacter actinomycetemcomitans]ANU82527.1 hypothetical protein BBH51_07590 [Aggregatibacter actinomycetemcomitans]EKX98251.1 conjugative transfer region protein family [Aggregatibacter actinomycetem
MSSDKEQTIPFLPNRLNKEATVFGGMTVSEFFIVAIIGFITGAIVGLFFVLLFGIDYWLFIPALAMLLCIASVLIGKILIARLKRGKPESYLNRVIEVKIDELLGGNRFIFRAGYWSIQRRKK